MDMPNTLKLITLKRALEKQTNTLTTSWEFSKMKAREKSEYKGESKTELDLVLDAYAVFSFACGMSALELLENDKLIVVSPSKKHEAACRLAATPFAFLGTKVAIDEILAIAKKNEEVKTEEVNDG